MQTALILSRHIIIDKVSSPSKKKLLVFLILGAMMINGFGLSAGETLRIGKWSAALVIAAAGQNLIISVLGKCNKTLTGVSNEISEYIKNVIFGAEAERGLASQEKNNKKEKGGQESAAAIKSEERKTERFLELAKWLSLSRKGIETINLRGANITQEDGHGGRGGNIYNFCRRNKVQEKA